MERSVSFSTSSLSFRSSDLVESLELISLSITLVGACNTSSSETIPFFIIWGSIDAYKLGGKGHIQAQTWKKWRESVHRGNHRRH